MAESDSEDFQRPLKRFRKSVSSNEEAQKLLNAVPASTRYKNKWAVKLFEDWKRERANKAPELEETSLRYDLASLESLNTTFEKMSP